LSDNTKMDKFDLIEMFISLLIAAGVVAIVAIINFSSQYVDNKMFKAIYKTRVLYSKLFKKMGGIEDVRDAREKDV